MDSTWVQELITGITKGVSLGYQGQRCQRISKNLISAFKHPQIIDEELLRLQQITGPFDSPFMANLQCSRDGVVPRKIEDWIMIMHLCAPQDSSINDGILKEDFTLHYSTIDNAVPSAQQQNSTSKNRHQSAFRTIPMQEEDIELPGIHWRKRVLHRLLSSFRAMLGPIHFQPVCRGPGMDPAAQLSHFQSNPLPG